MTPDDMTPDELLDYRERLLDETDQDQLWRNFQHIATFEHRVDERP